MFGPCRACVAKEAEILRLSVLVTTLTTETLRLARDAAGLTPPPPAGPPPDPLPGLVELFVDSRHDRGTRGWKQEMKAARQFLADGLEPLAVNERLLRGQPVEY